MTVKEIIAEIEELMKERDSLKEKCESLEKELKNYEWKPIETFDRSMFTLMTTGIPDSTEYVKYKGEVPEWAKFWMRVRPIPREI